MGKVRFGKGEVISKRLEAPAVVERIVEVPVDRIVEVVKTVTERVEVPVYITSEGSDMSKFEAQLSDNALMLKKIQDYNDSMELALETQFAEINESIGNMLDGSSVQSKEVQDKLEMLEAGINELAESSDENEYVLNLKLTTELDAQNNRLLKLEQTNLRLQILIIAAISFAVLGLFI